MESTGQIIELSIRVAVLLFMVGVFMYSFWGKTKAIQWVMSFVTTAAIFDYMGKFGEGVIVSLVLLGIAIFVIVSKNKRINHEK